MSYLSPKSTLGIAWLYAVGSIAWFLVLGVAAMNLRTFLVYDQNSVSIAPLYYTWLTVHGWAGMLGFVPNAAVAIIAYSMYKGGMVVRKNRLMSALFWVSNLGLAYALLGMPDVGWYMYPPVAIQDNSTFQAFLLYHGALLGVAYSAMALSSLCQVAAVVNLLNDAIHTKPNSGRLNIFTAYGVAFALVIALTLPALSASELWYAAYGLSGGMVPVDPLLWVILFWFYGHPVVYYVPFPLFGALYYYIPKFAGRELYSEKWARWNIYLLAIGSMLIWVHHLQTFPLPLLIRVFINLSTLILASGSGLTVLNLGLTILLGRGYDWRDPVGLSSLIALIGFIIGGSTALILPENPVNFVVHNTYYIVGHFHLVIWTLIVIGFSAVLLDMLRSSSPGFDFRSRGTVTLGTGLWTASFLAVGFLMSYAGYQGLIRREIAYPTQFQPLMLLMSLFAGLGISGLALTLSSALVEFLSYTSTHGLGLAQAVGVKAVRKDEGGERDG